MFTRNTVVLAPAAALILLAGSAPAVAQCGNSLKLTSIAPATGDEMGSAMSFGYSSGNSRLLVGAPKAEYGPYFNAGMVKLFAKIGTQWGELATIHKPTTAFHEENFGASVGFDNGRMIVGAPGVLTNQGAAYIYEFQGAWTPVATISGSQSDQRVGTAVAIDGDYAFIGAPGSDTANNPDSGLVSIQRRNANGTWSQIQTVSDTDLVGLFQNRALGAAVAAKGGLAVLAAPEGKEIPSPNFHGYVKVMRLQANGFWSLEADYLAPAPRRIGAHAGAAVATDGTRIVIGAPDYPYQSNPDGLNASSVGTVWVMKFESGAWVSEQQVKTPMPTGLGRFGASVAIHGDRLLVGEPGSKTAYAYRLVGSQWVLDRAFKDEDSAAGGVFASSVAVSDQNLFIGDTGDENNSTTDAGAVYLKALPAGYSDACEGAVPVTGSSISGCTMEATPDSVPLCGGTVNTASGKGVWVAWTPTCSGNVIMDTFGSDFDTVLSVHTDCSGAAGSMVACNDDGFPGPDPLSLLTFNYTAGTTYLINIRGYGLASGNFNLRINQWQVPSNDACTSPITVAPNSSYAFANCNATTDAGISNGCASSFVTRDVWYRFTAPAAGVFSLDTNGSTFDTILSVFAGSACPAATAVACDDDGGAGSASAVSMNVQAGQTYMIRVGGYSTTTPFGDGTLNVNFNPSCRCDWNLSGAVTVQDIFDFLAGYFAGNADMNLSGSTTVQDIFDFLACYFTGC